MNILRKLGAAMKKNICIIGAGNVGLTLGAYLSDKDNNIKIYKKEKIKEDRTNFQYSLEGAVNLKTRINLMTNNLKIALEGAEVVFITLPAFCRNNYLEELVDIVDKDIYLIFFPDNYGVLELDNILKKSDKQNFFKYAGTNTFVYPCRKKSDSYSIVKGIKKEIFLSSTRSEWLEEILEILNNMWDIFSIKENYLEIQFSNMNPVIHPAVLLMNLGRIENEKGNFDFYNEGITPTIAKIIEGIDSERIEVGRACGLDLKPLSKVMKDVYNSKGENLYKALTQSRVHKDGLAPKSLNTRYIKEDIPYGLAPISNIGKVKGVKTPIINAFIDLANIVMKKDYYKTLNIEKLIR
jgi:opine dehydrogenase